MIRPNGHFLFGVALSALGCSGAADIPATPDLSELQEQYDHPTAALDPNGAADSLREMPSLRALLAALRAAGFGTLGIDRAGSEAEADSTSAFHVQGSVRVTIRCPGELDEPVYGPNGTFVLTLGVDKSLIKRGIGGVADHCLLPARRLGVPARVELDGPVELDMGRDLGLKQRWSGKLLMRIPGTITVEDLVLNDLSARWTNDRLEYLFKLPEQETWVVAVVTEDGSVAIHDRNVTWNCVDQDNPKCAL